MQNSRNYPNYFNLKYSTKSAKVNDIQKQLDDKTAIRSYFSTNSLVYIFTLTNKKLDVQVIPKIKYLEDTIQLYRQSLTNSNKLMRANYRRVGGLLYQQLFPDSSMINKQIENLIIIPDGSLGAIPFETLLCNNAGQEIAKYKDFPFLIKKYNISYYYSVNLLYNSLKDANQKQTEQNNMNDWLAIAPVFSDEGKKGVLLTSSELEKEIKRTQKDGHKFSWLLFKW